MDDSKDKSKTDIKTKEESTITNGGIKISKAGSVSDVKKMFENPIASTSNEKLVPTTVTITPVDAPTKKVKKNGKGIGIRPARRLTATERLLEMIEGLGSKIEEIKSQNGELKDKIVEIDAKIDTGKIEEIDERAKSAMCLAERNREEIVDLVDNTTKTTNDIQEI